MAGIPVTDADAQFVAEQYRAGISMTEIGKMLDPPRSKNAVSGIIYRLGIAKRAARVATAEMLAGSAHGVARTKAKWDAWRARKAADVAAHLAAGSTVKEAMAAAGVSKLAYGRMRKEGLLHPQPSRPAFKPSGFNPGFQLIGKQDRRGPRTDAAADIAAWIAANGVTRCPVAALAPTTAAIPPADAAAIRQHNDQFAEAMANSWKRRAWPGPKGKQRAAA